jgi:hypothetical protein
MIIRKCPPDFNGSGLTKRGNCQYIEFHISLDEYYRLLSHNQSRLVHDSIYGSTMHFQSSTTKTVTVTIVGS